MAACNCNGKITLAKKPCPLCKEKGNALHHLIVREVVKENLKHLVQEEQYYICRNGACDIVFYNEEEEIMLLTMDIDMLSDFQEVCKTADKECHKGCGKCHKV